MKPMSEKQKNTIKIIEKNTGIKFTGKDTAQDAFLYLQENMNKSKENRSNQPWTDKQQLALSFIKSLIGIEYNGEKTLGKVREFIMQYEKDCSSILSQKESDRITNCMRAKSEAGLMNTQIGNEYDIFGQMELHQWENVENGWEDEEKEGSYGYTPTEDSLRLEVAYLSRFFA